MCVNKIHCSCQLSHNGDDTLMVNPGVTLPKMYHKCSAVKQTQCWLEH